MGKAASPSKASAPTAKSSAPAKKVAPKAAVKTSTPAKKAQAKAIATNKVEMSAKKAHVAEKVAEKHLFSALDAQVPHVKAPPKVLKKAVKTPTVVKKPL